MHLRTKKLNFKIIDTQSGKSVSRVIKEKNDTAKKKTVDISLQNSMIKLYSIKLNAI